MTRYEASGAVLQTPKEWMYRGEGNCNIVISLPKSKEILRIRKAEKPKSIFGWILVFISDFFYWYYGKSFTDEVRDLSFYSKVMRPLLGEHYTSESKQVFLTRKQMQIFKDGLIRKRPEFRQNKTLQYGRASLFHDFAFLPIEYDHLQFSSENTFSVEIKPKQGWRPAKEQIYPSCFFCMNQYLKLEKKMVKCRTKYCPEDLFSGDKIKMKMALKYLMEVPQNNFKIFKNGLVHYDDKQKNMGVLQEIFETDVLEELLLDDFCDLIQRCLITNIVLDSSENSISNSNSCKDCNDSSESIAINDNIYVNRLPKGSVLEKILSVQSLDLEGTHSTYKKLSKSGVWEDYSFVEKLLEVMDNKREKCVRCTIVEMVKSQSELMFLPYLVSAIAKDCSLMISFRKLKQDVSNDMKNMFETRYGTFLVNIGVFDLYPKPLSTIEKHYKRNKEIFKVLKKREAPT